MGKDAILYVQKYLLIFSKADNICRVLIVIYLNFTDKAQPIPILNNIIL
jgi:hypothetical protein